VPVEAAILGRPHRGYMWFEIERRMGQRWKPHPTPPASCVTMYLMFVDESGDTGLANSPSRYFILCGLVLHELRWKDTIDGLLAFRKDMRHRYGLKLREEIHSSHLINNPGPLARIEKYRRLEILRRFADVLAGMPDLNLVSVVVDKDNKPPGYDVFASAWTTLIQRFENTLSHRNFPGPKNPDDRGLLFCDHTDDKKLTALVRKMRTYNPVPNQPWAGTGYRNLTLRYVVEDPVFRDSSISQYIQAVDMCAYLLHQQMKPSSYFQKKSGQNYFNRLHPICCRFTAPRDPVGIVRI